MAPAARDVERLPAPGGAPPGRTGERAGVAGRTGFVGFVGLVGWLAVVGVALVWGALTVRHADVGLHAAPFKGHWAWHGGWRLLPAAGLGGAVAVCGPAVARWLRWPWVPVATAATAGVWTAALAAGDGWARLTRPLTTRHDYEPFAARIGDLGSFLSTYVDRLGDRPIHVQGHPPGPVVLAWALDHLGLAGAGWLAALVIACWGIAVAAALVTTRLLAGEAVARRVAPALAVLPAAVWAGTSLDPVFAALTAVAVALAASAGAAGPSARVAPVARAVGAGGVFGLALLSTYGAVLSMLVLVAAVAVAARGSMARVATVLVLVGAGALAMLALAGWAGFWWPEGLAATRAAYWDGIGGRRPAGYLTLVGNPAALALALGPAVAAGLATRTHALAWSSPRSSTTWRPPAIPGTAPPRPSLGDADGSGSIDLPRPRRSSGASIDAARLDRQPPEVADGATRLSAPRAARRVSRVRADEAKAASTVGVAGQFRVGETQAASTASGGGVRLASRLRGARAAGGWGGLGGGGVRLGVVVGAAVAAVVVADLSQLARGEVERIWLPFVPWLALAAPGDRRGWLAAQVAVALALQSFLVSPW